LIPQCIIELHYRRCKLEFSRNITPLSLFWQNPLYLVFLGAGILDNRRLLLLAKKVGEDWEPLGKALEVPEEELAEIREGEDSKTYQGAFKILWSWRQTQPPAETEESRNILRAALEKVGKQSFLEDLGK